MDINDPRTALPPKAQDRAPQRQEIAPYNIEELLGGPDWQQTMREMLALRAQRRGGRNLAPQFLDMIGSEEPFDDSPTTAARKREDPEMPEGERPMNIHPREIMPPRTNAPLQFGEPPIPEWDMQGGEHYDEKGMPKLREARALSFDDLLKTPASPTTAEEYAGIPSGTRYRHPDGSLRIKA